MSPIFFAFLWVSILLFVLGVFVAFVYCLWRQHRRSSMHALSSDALQDGDTRGIQDRAHSVGSTDATRPVVCRAMSVSSGRSVASNGPYELEPPPYALVVAGGPVCPEHTFTCTIMNATQGGDGQNGAPNQIQNQTQHQGQGQYQGQSQNHCNSNADTPQPPAYTVLFKDAPPTPPPDLTQTS